MRIMTKTKLTLFTAISVLAILVFSSCAPKTAKATNEKPNSIYILADDLGYAELGSFGQAQIETPNLDALAQNGIRFTQHYSGAPVCAPARCVLLTGKHMGHAQVRGNDEWGERGEVWDFAKAVEDPKLEGQRPLPSNTVTIGKLLQEAGYKTACVGKWGLGAPNTEGVPNKQGFDFFYGYNCQRQAHTYYPKHLWKNEEKVWLDNELVVPGTKIPKGADPTDSASYAKFNLKAYSPDLMFDETINFIKENKQNPFFLYWATPIPHAPLQAPQEWVDKYIKKFGQEEPYLGTKGYFPHPNPRAAYAAMVSYLDDQVGQLIQTLKDLDLYDNTLIIFTSDNGPTYNGGTDSPWFDSAKPFKSDYGRGKGFTFEGGIRVPMIASWPGRIHPGGESDHISAFWDVLPTLCDVAEIETPSDTDGLSFLPALLGKTQTEHEFLYWEFPSYSGQQAVRMGRWKALRHNIFKDNMDIELYDLSAGDREANNVADAHPEIVAKMAEIMATEHVPATIERFRMKQLDD